MKKILAVLTLTLASQLAAAAPQYSLQQICTQYGKFGQCATVPFCAESVIQRGCYLQRGAAAYMEGLCKLQTEKQGCAIMQAQGNCVWVEQAGSSCRAKTDSL